MRNFLRKTRLELIEVTKKLGLGNDHGMKRSGYMSSIMEALKRNIGQKSSEAAEKSVQEIRSTSSKAKKQVRAIARKAGPVQSSARRAVASIVKKTAEVAEKIILIGTDSTDLDHPLRTEKAADDGVQKEQAPIGGMVSPKAKSNEKVIHGTGDAEAAKYSIAEVPSPQAFPRDDYLGELAEGYDSERFFIVGRDPYWIFMYWDLSLGKLGEIKARSVDGKIYLQVHDVTGIIFDGYNAISTIEFAVPDGAKNWYAYVGAPGKDFIARLGAKTTHGFHSFLSSRKIKMPTDDFSTRNEASFVTIPFDKTFASLKTLMGKYIKEPQELAIAMSRVQAHGIKLPFEYSTMAIQGDLTEFMGLDGERYRRMLKGSEEILIRLKKEALENVSSISSASLSGNH